MGFNGISNDYFQIIERLMTKTPQVTGGLL